MISPLDGTMPQVSAPLTMPTVPTANGNGGAPAQKVQRPDRLEVSIVSHLLCLYKYLHLNIQ